MVWRSDTLRISAAILFGVAVLALNACSGIHHYTYEIEVTTDQQPHTNELYYESRTQGGAPEQLAYAVTFPQSYYAYRDNHNAKKQTSIGLVLDRKTFLPLTEVIASETGMREPLNENPFHVDKAWLERGPNFGHDFKWMVFNKFRARLLFVRIDGQENPNIPVDELKTRMRKRFDEMHDFQFVRHGFVIYKVRHMESYPDGGLPQLTGYYMDDPRLAFDCLPAVPRCGVRDQYRDSEIYISVERDALPSAPETIARIRKLLDRHLTYGGSGSGFDRS